jgi:hypothetical protein
MTTPNANFTAARTDAAQTLNGDQTLNGGIYFNGATKKYYVYTDSSDNFAIVRYSLAGAYEALPMRILPSNDIVALSGNFVVGASGKGIDFSADPSPAGMTSELLDDYEEGTFTATLAGFTTNPTTPVTSTSRYTKIGRQVSCQINFVSVDTTGALGAILVQGLPFAAGSETIGAAAQGAMSSTNIPAALLGAGATQMEIIASNARINLPFTAGAGQFLQINITYTV